MREAQVKLEQIQLDQESPEENMVVREEERLCQEDEEAQEQEEGEQAEQEVGLGRADYLCRGLGGEVVLGAALLCLGSPLLLEVEPMQTLDGLSWHNLGLVPLLPVCCAFLLSLQAAPALLGGWCVCSQSLWWLCHIPVILRRKVLILLWPCGQ